MDHAARDVMNEFKDIVLAFGESDEYRYRRTQIDRDSGSDWRWVAFYSASPRRCTIDARARYSARSRRCSPHHMSSIGQNICQTPPSNIARHLTGRIVLYPSITAVRDYFSWRQADSMFLIQHDRFPQPAEHFEAHINNMYNTVFWALVLQGGQTTTEAHATLRVRSMTVLMSIC